MTTELRSPEYQFSIAPMMDWTDRHCRYLHRLLTREALLFTEMVTSAAIIHGDRDRLLGYDDAEHPVAVQLGGSEPAELAEAARICADFGYDEINLNVGCPSDRVQSGKFGACLMAEPHLVAECVDAMNAAVSVPITVKCRIGIDDQDTEEALDVLADAVVDAGADALYVHARKAWLHGLSPKENRDIPPLDYPRVYRLAQRLAPLPVAINGGVNTIDESIEHLQHVSGVMLGRAAYKNPMILADVDRAIFGSDAPPPRLEDILAEMMDYARREVEKDTRINQITRHMLGLANGRPGARQFRQILTVEACLAGCGPEVIERGAAALERANARRRETATQSA
jgi:tRNA-dihydrouridine synthase A